MPNAPLERSISDDLGDPDLEPVPRRDRIDEAERRLWCAVIERAVLDAMGRIECGDCRAVRGRSRARTEARAWLRSRDRGPLSFRWLCDVLDLPRTAILDRLRAKPDYQRIVRHLP